MTNSKDQKSLSDVISLPISVVSLLAAIGSAYFAWRAVDTAEQSTQVSMMVELRQELNEATHNLVSIFTADGLNRVMLDLALFRWDSAFTLARDAANSGGIAPEHWKSTLLPLCELGQQLSFITMSEGSVRMESLKGECKRQGLIG